MSPKLKLGPRNKRRLAYAGIAVCIVVASVGAVLVVHPFDQAPVLLTRPYPGTGRFAIVSGMTQAEVLRKTGPPTRRRGSCWQYDANRPIQYRSSKGSRKGLLTAVKVCFYAHTVYDVQYQIDGKWPAPEQTRV